MKILAQIRKLEAFVSNKEVAQADKTAAVNLNDQEIEKLLEELKDSKSDNIKDIVKKLKDSAPTSSKEKVEKMLGKSKGKFIIVQDYHAGDPDSRYADLDPHYYSSNSQYGFQRDLSKADRFDSIEEAIAFAKKKIEPQYLNRRDNRIKDVGSAGSAPFDGEFIHGGVYIAVEDGKHHIKEVAAVITPEKEKEKAENQKTTLWHFNSVDINGEDWDAIIKKFGLKEMGRDHGKSWKWESKDLTVYTDFHPESGKHGKSYSRVKPKPNHAGDVKVSGDRAQVMAFIKEMKGLAGKIEKELPYGSSRN